MSPKARVSLFVAGLAAVLVAGFGLGSVVDEADTEPGASHGEMAQHGEEEMAMSEQGTEHGEHQASAPAGLAVSAGGYSLRLERSFATARESGELRFRIEDAEGEPVRDYDRLHEREMHLIVVRRDGTHFQHLHPEIDAAGTWSTPLTLPAAGVYRVFADFASGGEDQTLAADLFAAGSFRPRPFPAPGRYRLYLQFKHEGQVRTVEFMVEVGR